MQLDRKVTKKLLPKTYSMYIIKQYLISNRFFILKQFFFF